MYTVDPQRKGHFGISHFIPCRESVLFSEVEMYYIYAFGKIGSDLFIERLSLSWRVLYNYSLASNRVGIACIITTQ